MRQRAVLHVMHGHLGRFPIAIDDIDNLEAAILAVERKALGSARVKQRFAILDPQLPVLRTLGRGEIVEHVLIVDDAVLEDLDEGRALVLVRCDQHFW